MTATPYVFEVLYRGRPAGSTEPPAYHVILAVDDVDAFGNPTHVESPALNIEQAAAQGYKLPDLLAELNATTAASLEACVKERDALKMERDDLSSKLTAASQSALDNAKRAQELASSLMAMTAERDALNVKLAAVQSSPAPAR